MATLIERQIDDWEKRGVIEAATAQALRADIGASLAGGTGEREARSARRFSFAQVIAFFAALAFSAAVLLLIAANWDLIPRLVRVGGVMALIFAGFLGGVWARSRFSVRAYLVEEACYLVAGAAFVGGVALVAQMYHISGDERDAALTYALALGLSGFAVRSIVLVTGGLAFLTGWHLTGGHAANLLSLHFLVFAAGVGAVWLFAAARGVGWLRWAAGGALLLGLLPFAWETLKWLADLYDSIPETVRAVFWVCVWLAATAGLAIEKWRPGWLPLFRRRLGTFFVGGLLADGFLHAELDSDRGLLVAASMTIIFVVLALFAHGREHRVLRYVCYVIFVMEVLIVYGETVFSILGTFGFLLAVSVLLAAIAFIVYRFERRIARRSALAGGAGDA